MKLYLYDIDDHIICSLDIPNSWADKTIRECGDLIDKYMKSMPKELCDPVDHIEIVVKGYVKHEVEDLFN